MIPRYTRKEMEKIWSEENKLKKWLDIEISVLEGWSKIGVIPENIVNHIKEKAKIDIKKIKEIEKLTQHDVIAFVEQISESVGEEGKYIHFGLTSSDILDTSFALIIREAGEILLKDLELLADVLKEKTILYKDCIMIGRTHGIHAEPITLGFKFAGWYYETLRNIKRIKIAIEEISVGKISGAVGTYSNIDPRIEEYVCKKYNLKVENFSTQIISRDRYAFFLSILSVIASSAEKIALQIRLLQQTEISELAEPFKKGQKGSSAMPHKRNPILCERICGLSRVIKKNVSVALENVALWHERDISHSSAERVILPESTILLDYILNLLLYIFENIEVFPENMEKNVNFTKGIIFSQTVLNKLVEKGMDRKKAYEVIQKNAFISQKENKDFSSLIKKDEEVKKYLKQEEIEKIFNLKLLLKNIDRLFEKIGE